jgi:mannose-6-phosphate isomerase-like protein (cupin superfamily)
MACQGGVSCPPAGCRATVFPMEELRPWGFYEILADASDHKVKRITVHPGKRLSLQRHQRRSEHWHMVAGQAVVSVDGQDVELGPGDSVNIHCGATHRVHNPGDHPVIFIEVQRGDYFGEDDIERLADDFGRV